MIIVTREEFVKWVEEQPDDRLVNMNQFVSSDECGCVMVHYSREKFSKHDNFYCGGSHWSDRGETIARFDGFTVWDIVKFDDCEDYPTNYGTLKKCMIKH